MRTRLFTAIVCLLAGGFAAAPAEAQYGARRTTANRATGETYRVEVAGTIWNPTPDIVISSESLGILGDQVDFVNTLGIEKTKFKQLKLVLRPATKHKFRFEYTPIHYTAQKTGATPEQVYAGIADNIALGYLPPDEDCAEAVVFLASDRARSITGQTLDVNGGETFA